MVTRRKTSSDDKVQVMLVICGDVQKQLKGTARNLHVFDKIVMELASKGYKKATSVTRSNVGKNSSS